MIGKKNLKLIALILILFISIGFAYLTSSLVINGLIGYKANSWNIYFDNASMIINDVNGNKPTINNSKDTVDFSITFSEPGETYKFSVDVVNDGTIDAMLSEILKTGINSSNSSYLDYTVKYSDDTELSVNDGVRAGSKIRLNVEVKYKYETEELAPTGSQDFSIKLTYVQARDNANFKNALIKPDNNNVFTLNNVKSNSLNNLKIYGNGEQTTYKGYNLYNVNDYCSGSCVSNGATLGSDGWITITYDNTSGESNVYSNFFTNNLDLVIGDMYTIVMEVKNVSGTGTINYTSRLEQNGVNNGQLDLHYASFSSLHAGDVIVTTQQALDGYQWGLRSYCYWAPGNGGSITFRLSVIKGTSVTEDNFVYEPYVGGEASPNINYPQEVNTVTGNTSLTITGRNLFNKNDITTGYEFSNDTDVLIQNNAYFVSGYIRINPNKKYFILGRNGGSTNNFYDKDKNRVGYNKVRAGEFTSPTGAYYMRINAYLIDLNTVRIYEVSDDTSSYYEENLFNSTTVTTGVEFTTAGEIVSRSGWYVSDYIPVTPGESYAILGRSSGATNVLYNSNKEKVTTTSFTNGTMVIPNNCYYLRINGVNYDLNNTSVVKLVVSFDYEPYQEHVFPISLGSIELNKLGDYRDSIYYEDGDWYLEKKIGKYVYTGSESFTWEANIPRVYNNLNNNPATAGNDIYPSDIYTMPIIKSNKFITKSINDLYYVTNKVNCFTLSNNNVVSFRRGEWTSKAAAINDVTGTKIYYVYKNPIKEKITDTTLLGQLNAIKSSNLFDGVNHVYFDSGIGTDISFDYIEE